METRAQLRSSTADPHLDAHDQPSARLELQNSFLYFLSDRGPIRLGKCEVCLRNRSGPRFDRTPIIVKAVERILVPLPFYTDVPKACVRKHIRQPFRVGQCERKLDYMSLLRQIR